MMKIDGVCMRVVQPLQPQLTDYSFADIQFDLKSRDDIPPILRGLQYIYVNIELCNAVFKLLETHIQPDADQDNGRPGMCSRQLRYFCPAVDRVR